MPQNEWGNTSPVEPGWYWFQGPKAKSPRIAQVIVDGVVPVARVHSLWKRVEKHKGKWAGPILTPEALDMWMRVDEGG
jgi:hypothetical protein